MAGLVPATHPHVLMEMAGTSPAMESLKPLTHGTVIAIPA